MSDAPPDAPRRGRPKDSERGAKRARILDAAVTRFIDAGFGRTSIDDIAADARVTKRTIYTSFGDKAELFTSAIERFRLETLAAAEPDETLGRLAARIVYSLHSDEAVGLHRLMIAESPQFPELAAAFFASGPQGYIDLVSARIEDAERAEALVALLLGERHRQRLLGLTAAPTRAEATAQAQRALSLLGIAG